MELSTLELLRTTSMIGLAASATSTLYQLGVTAYHHKNKTIRDADTWRGHTTYIYEYPFSLSKAKKASVVMGLFLIGALSSNYFVNDMKDNTQMTCVDIKYAQKSEDCDCFLLDTDNNPKTVEYIGYAPTSVKNMTQRQNVGGVKVGTSMNMGKWISFVQGLERVD